MRTVTLVLAWLAGLLLGEASGWPAPAWLAGCGVGILGMALGGRWPRRRRRAARASVRWAGRHLAALCLAGLRLALAAPRLDAGHAATYVGTADVVLVGVVVREPEVGERGQRLTVAAEALTLPGGPTRAVRGRILATAAAYPRVPYGARVRLAGALARPPVFETFDYRDYLARRGIHAVVRYPRVRVLAIGEGQPLYAGILALKGRAAAVITRLLPGPEAALLRGILLGVDEGLPASDRQAFRRTGLSHVIAISGFNISLLAGWLVGLGTPFVGRRRATWPALGGIAAYTILVGADAAVVRAAIMGSLYLTGNRLLGRPLYAPGLLFVAAWLMTLANPFSLWDAGFQLSFAATLGLMLYADRLTGRADAWLRARLPARVARPVSGFLADAVIVTLAAQLTTLPLVLALFDQASPISPLANLLALPAQPALMVSGGLATLVGLLSPALAQPIAWVAWLPLRYTLAVVRLFGAVPWAAVPVAAGPWGVAVLYAVLGAATAFLFLPAEARREFIRRWLPRVPAAGGVGLALAAALLGLAWGQTQPDGRLHVTFFGPEQGGAALVRTPTGRAFFISADPAVELGAAIGRELPFWQRRLDLLVVMDRGERAVTALPPLLEQYHVARLVLVDAAPGAGGGPAVQALLDAAAGQGTQVIPARAGTQIRALDGVWLEAVDVGQGELGWTLAYGHLRLALAGAATMVAGQPVSRITAAVGGPATLVGDGRRFGWWAATAARIRHNARAP